MTTTPEAPQAQPPIGNDQPVQGFPPAAGQAAQKKSFFKKKRFIIPAGLVGIVIVVQALSGGSDTAPTGTTGAADDASIGSSQPVDGAPAGSGEAAAAPEAAEAAPAAAGIGQPAADGKFSFVVNGVDCDLTQIGSEYFNTTAQGKFCVVDLTISNIGNEPQSFFGDNAKLFNAAGQEFSADGEAAIYLEDSASLYEEINPGNTLNSKVVFDVPADMTPSAIELHDSAFSGGVTVNLQ